MATQTNYVHRLLFILDLNGTLLHRITKSSLRALAARHPQARSCDCTVNGNPIYYRVGHRSFLATLFNLGEVAIWTSAMPKNAHPMVLNLFDGLLDQDTIKLYNTHQGSYRAGVNKLLFLWTQNECNVRHTPGVEKPEFRKDLDRVWRAHPSFSADTTIMIDDSPLKLSSHRDNLIAVPEFLVTEDGIDHNKDDALAKLGRFLRGLSNSAKTVPQYLKDHPLPSLMDKSRSTRDDETKPQRVPVRVGAKEEYLAKRFDATEERALETLTQELNNTTI